jgi:hypothetical protein
LNGVVAPGRKGTVTCCVHVCPPASCPEKTNFRFKGAEREVGLRIAYTVPFAGMFVPVQNARFCETPSIVKFVSVVATPARSTRATVYGHSPWPSSNTGFGVTKGTIMELPEFG